MRKITLLLLICISVNKLHAWSLKTHVFIAQQVLNDVLDDKMVTLAGKPYAVPENIYNALRDHPDKFRMGSLGPDVFPDFIVGQVTTHPGIPKGWKTDDWLKHILSSAKTSEALAFAYGYVVHASSDIFAHTYVNMFAGDIFDLMDDEVTVELRHFVLEKYIEKFTPAIKNNSGQEIDLYKDLSSPRPFLASTLILNDSAFGQHEKSKNTTIHLRSMYKVRNRVYGVIDKVSALISFFARLASDKNGVKTRLNETVTQLRALKDRKKAWIDQVSKIMTQAAVMSTELPSAIEKEQQEVEKLIEQEREAEAELRTVEAEIAATEAMAERSRSIVGLIENWLTSIDHSTQQYILASDSAGLAMLNGESPVRFYTKWAECHGWAFVGVPDAIPAAWCGFKDFMKSMQEELRALKQYLPPVVQLALALINSVEEFLKDMLKPILLDKTESLVTNVFKKDGAMVELAYYMKWPEDITRKKLDSIYAKDISGKNLLKYDEGVSKYVIADMAVKKGYFDPEAFGPVANSLTLSKLALLDPKGLNQLITDNAGKSESALYGTPVYTDYPGNFTLLFDAVTSIDGNHQWQAYPLPYPRENNAIQLNSFGYDYYERPAAKKGFRIWVDPFLRAKVFTKLFNKTSMGSLSERLKQKGYPYPECDWYLFPTTIDDKTGKKNTQDKTCNNR